VLFYYAGRAFDGRRIRGSIEATSRNAAARHLRGRSVFVTSLETNATIRGAWNSLALTLRFSTASRSAFFRSFATLIGAGIPVRAALETLIRGSDGPFGETLRSLAAEVEGGTAFSKALELHPREFSQVAVAIVKAGEAGGSLDDALRVLADLEDRDRSLRKRVGAAMTYPVAVALAASVLVLFLLANTMPAFSAMFESMHVAVPVVTRILMAIGRRLGEPLPWSLLAALALSIVVAARRFKSSRAPWAAVVDRLRLRVPLLGGVVAKTIVARFARTLGSLLSAGVDIVNALDAAAGVVDGPVHRNGLLASNEALRRGETLESAFEASRLFDVTFLQLLRAGEEGGSIDAMLLRLAQYYELDVETALASLTSAIEPILICALGAAIGTIVASIIIPLYSMIGNLR
jgi:type IV pilus assembly protein PilC